MKKSSMGFLLGLLFVPMCIAITVGWVLLIARHQRREAERAEQEWQAQYWRARYGPPKALPALPPPVRSHMVAMPSDVLRPKWSTAHRSSVTADKAWWQEEYDRALR